MKRTEELADPIVTTGHKLCPNRFEQEFFSEKKGDRGLDSDMEGQLNSVLLAATDYRQDQNTALLETKVIKGLTEAEYS